MNFPKATSMILLLFISILLSSSNAAPRSKSLSIRLIKDFLSIQNRARAKIHMPPLIWDRRLARYANIYARKRKQDCLLKHSNGPYGENIFWGSGNKWSPVQAAASWVAEGRWYNRQSNSCTGGRECGHYTQIVWRRSKRIGCAKVTCFGGRGVFMTCNYDPPGNYIGEKPY
uniref:pathogenesis-related protein PR-1-like n=1 Tax=Erigeron canadensis TaxID=72917 RepID=UPI001CB98E30|nr:pathogenesis-related protein PR-1-like [Erigeron canadensis]